MLLSAFYPSVFHSSMNVITPERLFLKAIKFKSGFIVFIKAYLWLLTEADKNLSGEYSVDSFDP